MRPSSYKEFPYLSGIQQTKRAQVLTSTLLITSYKLYDKIKFSDDGLPMPLARLDSEPGALGPPDMIRRRKYGRKINVPTQETETAEPEPTKIRSLFPETWLWDIVTTGLVFKSGWSIKGFMAHLTVFCHVGELLAWDAHVYRRGPDYVWATSWENLFLPYANNKDADQPTHLRSLISAFVVRCLDSILPLLIIAQISRLACFCSWAGRFESYLVTNLEDRFSHDLFHVWVTSQEKGSLWHMVCGPLNACLWHSVGPEMWAVCHVISVIFTWSRSCKLLTSSIHKHNSYFW